MAAPRALISVYDKSGLQDFDRRPRRPRLAVRRVRRHRRTPSPQPDTWSSAVEEVTGAPEMLDGRVKTLHPAIHGGILARRSSDRHLAELADLEIGTIDLVAVNLYPFAATLAATDDRAELLENIDIGGVALIRAAAKNPDDVWTPRRPRRLPPPAATLWTTLKTPRMRSGANWPPRPSPSPPSTTPTSPPTCSRTWVSPFPTCSPSRSAVS